MRFLLIMTGVLTCFASCINSTKNGDEKRLDSGAVFYDYKVIGEEGSDSVTVLLQYRFGKEEELPTILESGSKVTLDGVELQPDSTKLSGVFYEALISADESIGLHTIVFTDGKGKSHSQQFRFLPFSLGAELPAQINKEPFTIQLKGFDNGPARVQLVMIDTAFSTKDVNEELLVKAGELKITAKMWRSLKAGPITLEIYREEKIPLKNGDAEEGMLLMIYRLKREFEAIEK